jgi:soluble lytic murein transglycosylase-like protein
MLQFLRHEHSVKIPSGRAAVRVDISFRLILNDNMTDISKLQYLVAMTRVTPFIPVTNDYLKNHLPFYSSELEKDPGTLGDSIPMAIFGMSLVVGGDSSEVVEVSMSLLFWNPMPFTGAEAIAWNQSGKDAILLEIKDWISENVEGKNKRKALLPIPTDAQKFVLRWWDLSTYSRLLARYPQLLTVDSTTDGSKSGDVVPNDTLTADPAQDYVPDLEARLQKIAQDLMAESAGKIKAVPTQFTEFNRAFKMNPRMAQWEEAIVSTAAKYNQDAEIMRRMIDTESRGNPNAVSPMGARGIAQFMPATAKQYGVDVNDPYSSIDGMGRYLRDLNNIFKGNITLAVAGYNAGQGNVLKYGILPGENQSYVNRIIGSSVNDPSVARLGTAQDPVVTAIRDYYSAEGPDPKPGAAQKAITRFWNNGRLPADPALRSTLVRQFGLLATSNGARNTDTGSGPIYKTSYGKRYGKTPVPFVDPEVVRKLSEIGWVRTSEDVRPLDPIFEFVGGPNVLDMTPAGSPIQRPNQVVTALSMSFQNRFVIMPVAGWPYPTIQHMGAFDSEIRVGIALLAENENFPIFRELNRMTHIMDTRSIDLRSSVYTGRDVFAITKIACENRILNAIGIDYAVLTDLQATRDPESPELIRIELGLTENGMVDEELFGHFTNSDALWKATLFEWLISKVWVNNAGLAPYAKKILDLWETQDKAFNENKKNIDDAIAGNDTPDAVKLLGALRGSLTQSEVSHIQVPGRGGRLADNGRDIVVSNNKFGVKYQFVPFKIGPPATPDQGRYRGFLLTQSDNYCQTPHLFPLPTDADMLLKQPFISWAGAAWRVLFGGLPIDDPEYSQGIAERYLEGSYGSAVQQAVSELAATPTPNLSNDPETVEKSTVSAARTDKLLKWFQVWNLAHQDWYKTVIILDMLNALARDFPDDFQNLVNQINQDDNRQSGCYRDLGLAKNINHNPYEWVDVQYGQQIADSMVALANTAEGYIGATIEYAKSVVPAYEEGVASRAEWDTSVGKYWKDNAKHFQPDDEQRKVFAQGVDNAYTKAPESISAALAAVKRITPVQFTVRRAFPAFKLYFVEESNGGLVKTFDEFYSYNAVLDWNLIEQANQGSTLVLTLSNIFNHLDALILNETIDMQGLSKTALAAMQQGGQPIRSHKGPDGTLTDVGLDGRSQPLANIALKPGTKIVLKVGYNNNPAKLETIFTGQVTEVQAGDTMTIVCQGWESELFGTWDPEVDYPFSFWWLRKPLSTIEEDPTKTAGTTQLLKAVMRHPQCKHFGHWQVGAANPFDLFSWSYLENKTSQKAAGGVEPAGDRSSSNIRPTSTPFYDVFGLHTEIETTAATGRVLWEIIQELRLTHPNNIAMVRPYGNGDATLYFGPPYGTYTATDFVDGRGLFNNNAFDDVRFEAFKRMIKRDAKAQVNRLSYSPGDVYIGGLDNDIGPPEYYIRSIAAWITKDTGISLDLIPVSAILQDPRITSALFGATGKPAFFRNEYARIAGTTNNGTVGNKIGDAASPIIAGLVGQAQGLDPLTLAQNVVNSIGDTNFTDAMFAKKILDKDATDPAMRLYFDAINQARYVGIQDPSDTHVIKLLSGHKPIRASWLNYILRLIDQEVIRILFEMKERADKDDPELAKKLRILPFLVKDVRRWHIVTSRHHIIANNIEVNSDFANVVRVGKELLTFDPGLEDKRTRDFSAEFGTKLTASKSNHGYMAANLLASELRQMYRGELIITGNPEIRPHDVLVIIDDTRQIYGMVEVEKVVNSMTLETGYITVITPALMVEVGDMTMAHAYQSFYSALAKDIHNLNSTGGKFGEMLASAIAFAGAPATLGDVDDFAARNSSGGIEDASRGVGQAALIGGGGTAAVGGALWVGGVAGAMEGVGIGTIASSVSVVGVGQTATALGGMVAAAPVLPIVIALAATAVTVGGFMYISWLNNSIKDQYKSHPLTITPLVKRGMPWVGGIDGTAGRTAVGQLGRNMVKGLRDIGKMGDIASEFVNTVQIGTSAQKTVDDIKQDKPSTGP